jgi:hypothetical protein
LLKSFYNFIILNYHSIRLRWCLSSLSDLIRRWSVYLVVGAVVLAGGGAFTIPALASLAALSVALLVDTAGHSPVYMFLMCVLHSQVGTVTVFALRPALWPLSWAEAERALPVARGDYLRSDAIVVVLALVPLFGLYLAGALIWVLKTWETNSSNLMSALALLLMSALLSVIQGIAVLQAWRRTSTRHGLRLIRWPEHIPMSLSRGNSATIVPLGLLDALFVLPLVRGPALRSRRFLGLSSIVLVFVAVHCDGAGSAIGWWLASLCVISLVTATRLRVLVNEELQPLHAHCAVLPLKPASLVLGRRLLIILPVSLGLTLLVTMWLAFPVPGMHPTAAAAYVGVTWMGSAMQAWARPARPTLDISRWIFVLVLAVACASEVVG